MLRTELQNDPAGLGYDLQDYHQIEQLINAKTQYRLKPTEIGKGDAVNKLGLSVGNALCDVFDNTPEFRHVKHLLEAGRLRLDYQISQDTLQSMVGITIAPGVVFTQGHVDALNTLATVQCSRAEILGLTYVDDAMIREALA